MINFKTRRNDSLLQVYRKLYSFYGTQGWWPGDSPIEIAIGAILTQNTNWANVEKAINNLKRHDLLTAQALYNLHCLTLAELIRPAGYYNVKAKRLKAFIDFLVLNYGGCMKRMKEDDTASLRNKLLGVHGIGNETADSILLYALDKPVFVIDTYTKRVLSRHGIIDYKTSYEEYQKMFHDELDVDTALFNEYHALFVMVGKQYCRPKPVCDKCPLSNL